MKKILLSEDQLPDRWYNILPDLPEPVGPFLHPATLEPMGPADLAPLFPMAIIQQEVSAERWIDIPDPVRDVYRMWRPTPLFRADRLERALDTPARIFYKYEGVSPAGSHKPNTAVPQAYYNASTLCTMPTRDVPELQRDHHRGDDRVLHLNADCRWRSEASCHST
jgi:tryptophan synthase beta chain